MIDHHEALESVIRHASQPGELDYDAIRPAVDALTNSRDLTLVPRLLEALDQFLDQGNVRGRDLIARLLTAIARTAALPALLLAAAHDLGDSQHSLQADIADLLTYQPVEGRLAVLELVRSDVPAQRRVGLLALPSVAQPADAGVLIDAAAHPDADVRLAAVTALFDPATDARAFQALVTALHDPDDDVRAEAISRLGAIRRAEALAPLSVVAGDPSPRIRAAVAFALGRLRTAAATPTLLGLLTDPDRQVRDKARDALGSIGAPAAVDALLGQAAEDDPKLRANAAKALAKAVDADPRAEPQLLLMARDGDPTVRAATLSGLATVVGTSTRWASLAVELADDPDPTVRHRVSVVVHLLAPDQAGDVLRRLTGDPNGMVAETATAQLALRAGSSGTPRRGSPPRAG